MTASVSLAGQPCLSPAALYRQCLELRLSVDWFGKPNSFTCPLGGKPGRGYVLLTRGQLDAIDPLHRFGGLYNLTFSLIPELSTGPSGAVVLHSVVITGADCLTPGLRGDPAAAYLVGLSDRRWPAQRVPVD